MPPRRAARWQDDREGAALRHLFESGEADPKRTNGTEHMNEVFTNHSDLFGHIENPRNFHNAFRRTAAEYLTNKAQRGARRRSEGQETNTETKEEEDDDEDDDTGMFVFPVLLQTCIFALTNSFSQTTRRRQTCLTWTI